MVQERLDVQLAEPGRLRLVGELEMETAAIFEAAIESIPRGNPVTLDLSELSFIDSWGMHTLAKYAVSLDGKGPLTLVHVPSFALRLFEIVGLDRCDAIRIS